jgi:hypothetical protein
MTNIRRTPSASRSDLEGAAAKFFVQMAQELDRPREFHPVHYDEDIAYRLEMSGQRSRELDEQLVANSFDGQVRHRAQLFASAAGMEFDELGEREQVFAQQLAARAEREQMQLLIHQLKQPHVPYRAEDNLFSRVVTARATDQREEDYTAPRSVSRTSLREAATIYLQRKAKLQLSQSQLDETARPLT